MESRDHYGVKKPGMKDHVAKEHHFGPMLCIGSELPNPAHIQVQVLLRLPFTLPWSISPLGSRAGRKWLPRTHTLGEQWAPNFDL